MATCQGYTLKINPVTKEPYKSFCPVVLHESTIKRGGQYCTSHIQTKRENVRTEKQPRTERVDHLPEARRFE